MKNNILFALILFSSALLFSCGESENAGPGQMDTSVIGYWEGMLGELSMFGFDGARIYTRIKKTDSSFQLISLTLDTASTIRDTTLIMAGKWRLNTPKDSILLLPDTCRIIDTTLDSLVPRDVKGTIIPLPIQISRNSSTGDIEWMVSFADMVPVAPLLGINLSGIDPRWLKDSKITMFKRSQ
jgi:hypothetical protein